jgi:hypothetical protein
VAEADKRTNGASIPAGWEEWPTLSEAANLTGISRARLTTYIKTGALKKHVAPNSKGAVGTYKINPDELEALEAAIADDDAKAEAPTTADVVRASVEGLKQAQAHSERLVTLFEQPYRHVVDALRDENNALRSELTAMRVERAANEVARESMRSTQALESMALLELKGQQDTKREAFELAKKLGGVLYNKHLANSGVPPELIQLKEAVESIPPDMFGILFKMGILPEAAAAKLKAALKWKDEPEPEAPAAAAPAPEEPKP